MRGNLYSVCWRNYNNLIFDKETERERKRAWMWKRLAGLGIIDFKSNSIPWFNSRLIQWKMFLFSRNIKNQQTNSNIVNCNIMDNGTWHMAFMRLPWTDVTSRILWLHKYTLSNNNFGEKEKKRIKAILCKFGNSIRLPYQPGWKSETLKCFNGLHFVSLPFSNTIYSSKSIIYMYFNVYQTTTKTNSLLLFIVY